MVIYCSKKLAGLEGTTWKLKKVSERIENSVVLETPRSVEKLPSRLRREFDGGQEEENRELYQTTTDGQTTVRPGNSGWNRMAKKGPGPWL